MTRVSCPTAAAAQALADYLDIAGHASTCIRDGGRSLVYTMAPRRAIETAPAWLWESFAH